MDFSFVQISDHHLLDTEEALRRGFSPAYAFRKVMRHIAETVGGRIDFIVSTGDLVEPPSAAAYVSLREMLALQVDAPPPGPQRVSIEGLRDMPMYFLPGNHDERALFRRAFSRSTGDDFLVNARFEHQGVQFVCIDWGENPKAVASAELLAFLSGALESGAPSIILSHHHVLPIGSRWLDDFIAEDIDAFWRIVSRWNVLGILCGHVHITYEKQKAGIPVYGVRSTAYPFVLQDEPLIALQPPHYRLVSVRDGLLTTRVFEVPI